jgi:hypothetical protein
MEKLIRKNECRNESQFRRIKLESIGRIIRELIRWTKIELINWANWWRLQSWEGARRGKN